LKSTSNIEKAKVILCNHALALVNGDFNYASDKKGIIPLMEFIERDIMRGGSIVDKVVGRAAAFLMLYGGVKEVHAVVISEGACEVFDKFNLPYSYDKKVSYISNRMNDGQCPMEEAVIGIDVPEVAYEVLKQKLNNI